MRAQCEIITVTRSHVNQFFVRNFCAFYLNPLNCVGLVLPDVFDTINCIFLFGLCACGCNTILYYCAVSYVAVVMFWIVGTGNLHIKLILFDLPNLCKFIFKWQVLTFCLH